MIISIGLILLRIYDLLSFIIPYLNEVPIFLIESKLISYRSFIFLLEVLMIIIAFFNYEAIDYRFDRYDESIERAFLVLSLDKSEQIKDVENIISS